MTLPKAIVNSFGAVMRSWCGLVLRVFAWALGVGVPASVCIGLAVGASRAGCKNEAIAYAKTVWPEAACSAISTASGCGRPDALDTAVCRVGERRFMCTSSDGEPTCKEVAK